MVRTHLRRTHSLRLENWCSNPTIKAYSPLTCHLSGREFQELNWPRCIQTKFLVANDRNLMVIGLMGKSAEVTESLLYFSPPPQEQPWVTGSDLTEYFQEGLCSSCQEAGVVLFFPPGLRTECTKVVCGESSYTPSSNTGGFLPILITPGGFKKFQEETCLQFASSQLPWGIFPDIVPNSILFLRH